MIHPHTFPHRLQVRAHKRFPSASTSLANEASVIPEDPREHLYTHWRQDPFSNPTPAVTSLPLKNTFQLDYKMNLTYAQLAEHRRQQRVADLEEKTGKKLSDLNAGEGVWVFLWGGALNTNN